MRLGRSENQILELVGHLVKDFIIYPKILQSFDQSSVTLEIPKQEPKYSISYF